MSVDTPFQAAINTAVNEMQEACYDMIRRGAVENLWAIRDDFTDYCPAARVHLFKCVQALVLVMKEVAMAEIKEAIKK